MKKSLFVFAVALLVSANAAWAQIASKNFDWDNNIATLRVKLVVFHKTTNESKELTTEDLATYGATIGKTGTLADYEFRIDEKHPEKSSFKFYSDGPNGENTFLEQLVDTLANEKPEKWQGMMWDDFVTALSNPNTAKEVTIITARGHDPASILDALKYLQGKGYIRYLPELKNIFPVSNPKIGGDAVLPAATKAKVILTLLDALNARPLTEGPKIMVRNANDEADAALHEWDFSDDDTKNIVKAYDVLKDEVAKGRWPNVKITLTYTGAPGKLKPPFETTGAFPKTYVFKSDGTIRPASRDEVADFAKHMMLMKCAEVLQDTSKNRAP